MTVLRSMVIVAMLALSGAAPAAALEAGAEKSTANNVTVTVTPDFKAADTWTFKVVLDTHSQELRDDLTKTAVLIDPAGKRHAPLAWEGAAPGGHHREGVLRFTAISPTPAYVQLQLSRDKEATPRVFRWKLQ